MPRTHCDVLINLLLDSYHLADPAAVNRDALLDITTFLNSFVTRGFAESTVRRRRKRSKRVHWVLDGLREPREVQGNPGSGSETGKYKTYVSKTNPVKRACDGHRGHRERRSPGWNRVPETKPLNPAASVDYRSLEANLDLSWLVASIELENLTKSWRSGAS